MDTQFTPDSFADQHCHEENGVLFIAYLAHDSDCQNPLEDSCGLGRIIGRGRYETQRGDEDAFCEALGLDPSGEPDLNHPVVTKRAEVILNAWVASITDAQLEALLKLFCEPEETDVRELRSQLLAGEADPQFVALDYVFEALWACHCIEESPRFDEEDLEGWPALELDWQKLWEEAREAGEIGDPDAVLLDVYDHSGIAWSLHGGGMQCQWDTSQGAGVWAPDEHARENITRLAPIFDHARIVSTNYTPGHDMAYRLHHNGPVEHSDAYHILLARAEAIAEECVAAGTPPAFNGRRCAAIEEAKGTLEQYNAWLCGNCYGVCYEAYLREPDGKQGERIEEDACWGVVGSDYAQEELLSGFDGFVKRTLESHDKETQRATFPVGEVGV